ncbi:hypothetical protein HK100_000156 [Physocladia obscura]|uniref:GDP/GTP exchange factor Sec2 N-terminal domain-containing protein n=1 Tax=Physocladia obscura TaxID=109957 RepID=A0AAD5T1L1_9FUNG|nr:hypothetical protein HK100_000156 [Physocladia obscura]
MDPEPQPTQALSSPEITLSLPLSDADSPVNSRLAQVSRKYSSHRLSIDTLTTAATGTTAANPAAFNNNKSSNKNINIASAANDSNANTNSSVNFNTSVSTSMMILHARLASLAVLTSPTQLLESSAEDTQCVHRSLFPDDTDGRSKELKCSECAATSFPVVDLLTGQLRAIEDAQRRAKRDREFLADSAQTSAQDLIHLHSRIDALTSQASLHSAASTSLKSTVLAETSRVLDLVESRLALQDERDALTEEIEGKTQELFERANSLVSDEAKKRFVSQTRVRALESELDELESQLALERMQLSELRAKMDQVTQEREASKYSLTPSTSSESNESSPELTHQESIADNESIDSVTPKIAEFLPTVIPTAKLRSSPVPQQQQQQIFQIDTQLLADLRVFIHECAETKLSKLHTLPFLKTCLEEDIYPCLKFGGSGRRTNSRKLVDAILANTCFVEELNASSLARLKVRHDTLQHALFVQSENAKSPAVSVAAREALQTANQTLAHAYAATRESPTHGLFQTTVMASISSWTSRGTAALPASIVLHGCSACGLAPTVVTHHFRVSEQQQQQHHGDESRGLGGEGEWFVPICAACKTRLVAVCEFYGFVRHLRLGLYSTRKEEAVWREVLGLRMKMWEARCGGGIVGGGGQVGGGAGNGLRPDSVLLVGLS